MKNVDDLINKTIQEISKNHEKIIDDWCKAYLSELYEAGLDIKPGCFTLYEQYLDSSHEKFGKRYYFKYKDGSESYDELDPLKTNINWISVHDRLPESMDSVMVCFLGHHINSSPLSQKPSYIISEGFFDPSLGWTLYNDLKMKIDFWAERVVPELPEKYRDV